MTKRLTERDICNAKGVLITPRMFEPDEFISLGSKEEFIEVFLRNCPLHIDIIIPDLSTLLWKDYTPRTAIYCSRMRNTTHPHLTGLSLYYDRVSHKYWSSRLFCLDNDNSYLVNFKLEPSSNFKGAKFSTQFVVHLGNIHEYEIRPDLRLL